MSNVTPHENDPAINNSHDNSNGPKNSPESLLEALNKFTDDDLNNSNYSSNTVASMEVGYFCSLKADFKSTEEEIRK